MTRSLSLSFAACAGAFLMLVAASPLRGQDEALPPAGSWSITAALPGGGGETAGLWRMVGARTNLGIEVDFRRETREDRATSPLLGADVDGRDRRLIVGPTVKHYLSVRDPIAAYARASLGLGWRDIEQERVANGLLERDTTDETRILRLSLGADWFPFDGVAIGAFTGLFVVWDKVETRVADVGTVSRTTTSWNTFKSGIELQYYF